MNKKFYCLALGAFLGGILVSCTNELNEPITTPPTGDGTIKLVRAPEVYAWSGNQILGNTFNTNTRGEEITYYDAMPDFTDWCNSWWNDVPSFQIPTSPSQNQIVYQNTDDAEEDDETGQWKTEKFVMLPDLADGTKIYVDGAISFYDAPTEGVNLEFYISKNSWVIFDWSDAGSLNLQNVTIYNEGVLYIYDSKESIGEGTTIYNSGELVVEQNYVAPNDDLSLTPLIITQPIYSIGEVIFKGGVSIKTDETYFKKVCVDGQMTVAERKTTHTGYLNCDELYCHDGAKVEMAPEGAIIAGTISMIESARIFGSSKANGFILTNHILGENLKNNGEVGNKMESEVNKENFDKIFNNVNILVTQGINNEGDQETVEAYKPTNGKTIFLGMIPFDASNDDDNFTVSGENGEDYKGVKTLSCGLGYEFIPKTIPDDSQDNCEKCGHPSHGDTCDDCKEGEGCNKAEEQEQPEQPGDDVVFPGMTTVPDNVEINLSIEERPNIEWLASHLSIHVRAATDVEVFIPLPAQYYCQADDMAIVMQHETNHMVHGGPLVLDYQLKDSDLTVKLTVAYEPEGIRVTTDGIDEEVIAWCKEKCDGDGITFEVWNYMNITKEEWNHGIEDENGFNPGAITGIDKETLQGYLNESTVKFLDKVPDLYVNAFNDTADGGKFADDCTVTPTQDGFNFTDTGIFYNGSPYNERYWKEDPNNGEE